MPECFFKHLGGCEGRLVKAHLIPAQRLRRDIPTLLRAGKLDEDRPFDDFIWDPRVWTWMCGGLTGIGGHHGQFDAVQIEIERDDLPEGLEEYAREYGLEWSLEADYGLPSDFAA